MHKIIWFHFGRIFWEIGIVDLEFDPPKAHGNHHATRRSNSRPKNPLRISRGKLPQLTPVKIVFRPQGGATCRDAPVVENFKRPGRDAAAQKISSRSVARYARYSTRKFDAFCGATWRPVNVSRRISCRDVRLEGPQLRSKFGEDSQCRFGEIRKGRFLPASRQYMVAKKFYQRSRLLNSSTLCVFGVDGCSDQNR